MAALKSWLSASERADRVKPIFMSTTALMLQGDPWEASPEQLSEILNYIKEKRIKYVAFFSGDIHCGKSGLWAYADEDEDKDDNLETAPLYILETASSAFHKINANKAGLLTPTLDLSANGGPHLSAIGRFSPTTLEDHFTRVIIDHDNKTVAVIKKNRHNAVLVQTLYNLETGDVSALDTSEDSAAGSTLISSSSSD